MNELLTCLLLQHVLWHEFHLAISANITLTSSLDGAQAACPGEVVTYTCTALRTIAIEWTVTPGIPSAAFFQEDTITEKTIGDFQLALTSRIPNGIGTSDLTSTLTVTTTASHNGTIIQCVSDNGRAKLELRVATSTPPPPLNPVYHVQSFNQHNVTIIMQWGYEHRHNAHNYTIAGTHFLTTSTETNEIIITLPYNELQTINVTANNCIGSSSAATVTFFELGCMNPNPPKRGFIEGFDSAEENATLTYRCSPDLVPWVQMSSVCTNMSWRPDPSTLECREPLPGQLGIDFIDCGTPVPPISGLLQPYNNTTEGSMVVFYCNSSLVPEGDMTAVCGSDGQWNPNPGSLNCTASGQIPVAQMVVVVVVACTCTLLLTCVITIVGFVRFKKHMHRGCSVKTPTAGPRTQSFNRHHQSEMQFPAENIESPSPLRSVMNAKCNQNIEAQYSELKATEAMQNQLGISYAELGPQAMSQLVRPPSKQGITVEYSEMQLLQVDASEIHPVAQNTEELQGYLPIDVGMTPLPSSPSDTDDFPPPVPPKYFVEEDYFPPPPKLPPRPCEESKENIALPSFLPKVHQQGTQQSDTVAPHRPPKGHLRGTPSNIPPGAPKAGCFNRI